MKNKIKDIHSPPVVAKQPMGIRQKVSPKYLTTYECHSMG